MELFTMILSTEWLLVEHSDSDGTTIAKQLATYRIIPFLFQKELIW
jgi:hypothetical protein